jgi:hypothetical protein
MDLPIDLVQILNPALLHRAVFCVEAVLFKLTTGEVVIGVIEDFK